MRSFEDETQIPQVANAPPSRFLDPKRKPYKFTHLETEHTP